MNAKAEILKLAKERLALINSLYATRDLPGFERVREQLAGILMCLNQIAYPDREIYCMNYFDDGVELGYELGYYEQGHRWRHLAGAGKELNV